MFENIRADIGHKLRWFYEDAGRLKILIVLVQPGTIAVLVYRFGQWAYGLPPILRPLFAIPYWVANLVVFLATHILIWPKAKIGKGLVIHNFGTSILIGDTTIGENCIVYQGVTIANVRHYRGKGRPRVSGSARIGNNVYLAAGCKVLGNITIGDNVVVGANSVVLTSVPDNCTVMGVPARIISRNNRWITEKLEATRSVARRAVPEAGDSASPSSPVPAGDAAGLGVPAAPGAVPTAPNSSAPGGRAARP